MLRHFRLDQDLRTGGKHWVGGRVVEPGHQERGAKAGNDRSEVTPQKSGYMSEADKLLADGTLLVRCRRPMMRQHAVHSTSPAGVRETPAHAPPWRRRSMVSADVWWKAAAPRSQ